MRPVYIACGSDRRKPWSGSKLETVCVGTRRHSRSKQRNERPGEFPMRERPPPGTKRTFVHSSRCFAIPHQPKVVPASFGRWPPAHCLASQGSWRLIGETAEARVDDVAGTHEAGTRLGRRLHELSVASSSVEDEEGCRASRGVRWLVSRWPKSVRGAAPSGRREAIALLGTHGCCCKARGCD